MARAPQTVLENTPLASASFLVSEAWLVLTADSWSAPAIWPLFAQNNPRVIIKREKTVTAHVDQQLFPVKTPR